MNYKHVFYLGRYFINIVLLCIGMFQIYVNKYLYLWVCYRRWRVSTRLEAGDTDAEKEQKLHSGFAPRTATQARRNALVETGSATAAEKTAGVAHRPAARGQLTAARTWHCCGPYYYYYYYYYNHNQHRKQLLPTGVVFINTPSW